MSIFDPEPKRRLKRPSTEGQDPPQKKKHPDFGKNGNFAEKFIKNTENYLSWDLTQKAPGGAYGLRVQLLPACEEKGGMVVITYILPVWVKDPSYGYVVELNRSNSEFKEEFKTIFQNYWAHEMKMAKKHNLIASKLRETKKIPDQWRYFDP